MKTCTKCGVEKSVEAFSRDRGSRCAQCKACRLIACKAWQAQDSQKHPEKYRAYAAKQRHDHPERVREARRKWEIENPEKKRESLAAWRARNHDKVVLHRESRNTMHRAARVKFADRRAIAEIYDSARRRTKATGVRHQVDHIVPLQSPHVCGLHVEHNLQVIPAAANNSKHNRRWPDMPEDLA